MRYSFNILAKIMLLSLLSCVNNQKTESSQKIDNQGTSIVNGDHIIIDEFSLNSPKNKSRQDSLTINISFRSTIDSIYRQLIDSVKLKRSTFLFIKEFDQSSGIPPLEEIDESVFEIYVLEGSGDYEVKVRPQICGDVQVLFLVNDQLQYPFDDNNIRWIQDVAIIKESTFWKCEE